MKLILAVVLFGCMICTCFSDCDDFDAVKVQRQWSEAFGKGYARLDFGLRLWKRIFHSHPSARILFQRVNGFNVYSPEFEAHSQRVLSGLDMTISLLDNKPALKAQIAHLHGQHQERNIAPENFDYFREALLAVLPHYLGTHLAFDAWTKCFNYIASGIK